MKAAFLTKIMFSYKENPDLSIMAKSAKANGYKMFCVKGKIYSVEHCLLRIEKNYADMSEAIIFELTDVVNP